MKELLKKPFEDWTRDELIEGQAFMKRSIDAQHMGHLADQRVARDSDDPHASNLVLEMNETRIRRLQDFTAKITSELAKRPIPIIEHPRDDVPVLVFHRTHGWIEGRFCKGEMVPHFEHGPQYDGPVWVLGDDIEQVEVEEQWDPIVEHTILYHDGPITHYLPLPAKPVDDTCPQCSGDCAGANPPVHDCPAAK